MKLSLRGNLTTFHFNLSNTRRGPKAQSVDLQCFDTQIEGSLKGEVQKIIQSKTEFQQHSVENSPKLLDNFSCAMTMILPSRGDLQRNVVSLQNNVITLESNTLPACCLWRSLYIGLVLAF